MMPASGLGCVGDATRPWRRVVLAGLVSASLHGGLAAQAPFVPTLEDVGRASSLVRFWAESGRVPGAVLSVRQNGRTVYEASYGHARSHRYGGGQYHPGRSRIAELDDPVPMTVETVFDLASVTKVMATTTAVALLVSRGELDVEDRVSAYLPDFVEGGKDEITLAHLLTHRSGLSQWKPIYYSASTPEEAYRFIRDLPLEWPVGAERHYSDLGFMTLGLVIERVTGAPLPMFLEEELYGPLRLTSTGFWGLPDTEMPFGSGVASTSHGNPFERRMVHDPDFGYRIAGDPEAWDEWREHTLSGEVNDGNAHHAFGGAAGHAGLFSSQADLQILLELWLNDGVADGRRYLAADVVERFLAPTGDGQALGWQLPDYAHEGSFSHTGFTGTFVFGDPTSRLGIVLLTNRQNGGVDEDTGYPDLSELQREVVEALTGGRRPG